MEIFFGSSIFFLLLKNIFNTFIFWKIFSDLPSIYFFHFSPKIFLILLYFRNIFWIFHLLQKYFTKSYNIKYFWNLFHSNTFIIENIFFGSSIYYIFSLLQKYFTKVIILNSFWNLFSFQILFRNIFGSSIFYFLFRNIILDHIQSIYYKKLQY